MIGGTNWAFRCRLSFEMILYILTWATFPLHTVSSIQSIVKAPSPPVFDSALYLIFIPDQGRSLTTHRKSRKSVKLPIYKLPLLG